jgi:hypothetical protein
VEIPIVGDQGRGARGGNFAEGIIKSFSGNCWVEGLEGIAEPVRKNAIVIIGSYSPGAMSGPNVMVYPS